VTITDPNDANATEFITIKNATNPNAAIEKIELSDGTLLSIEDMQSATEGDDTLVYGSAGNEVMYLNNRYDEKYQTVSINSSENLKKQDIMVLIFKEEA
jgi:hypothetical protein